MRQAVAAALGKLGAAHGAQVQNALSRSSPDGNTPTGAYSVQVDSLAARQTIASARHASAYAERLEHSSRT